MKEYSVKWSDEIGVRITDIPYGEGELNKFDLYLFCKALGNCLLNNINDSKYSSSIKLYSELLNFERKLNFVSNKKQLFENMITKMWNISRGDN